MISEPWTFTLGVPAWIPWQTGKAGINGVTSNFKLGPNDLIPKLDMIATVRAEAHQGPFGIMGEYSYMSLSDGVGTTGLGKKLDVRVDQSVGELALSWRVIHSDKGFVDVFAGARYTNLYQALGIHPDEQAIDQASQQLVDNVAQRLGSAAKVSLGSLVQQHIGPKIDPLRELRPVLPEGPVADALRAELLQRAQGILAKRVAELQAAIQSNVAPRVAAAKASLSNELATALKRKLNTKVSRTDQWVDPILGVKGHYDLSKAVYLTGRVDIGGFGIGSEFAWQVNAGVGFHITRYFSRKSPTVCMTLIIAITGWSMTPSRTDLKSIPGSPFNQPLLTEP